MVFAISDIHNLTADNIIVGKPEMKTQGGMNRYYTCPIKVKTDKGIGPLIILTEEVFAYGVEQNAMKQTPEHTIGLSLLDREEVTSYRDGGLPLSTPKGKWYDAYCNLIKIINDKIMALHKDSPVLRKIPESMLFINRLYRGLYEFDENELDNEFDRNTGKPLTHEAKQKVKYSTPSLRLKLISSFKNNEYKVYSKGYEKVDSNGVSGYKTLSQTELLDITKSTVRATILIDNMFFSPSLCKGYLMSKLQELLVVEKKHSTSGSMIASFIGLGSSPIASPPSPKSENDDILPVEDGEYSF